jgi:hypothetical protein
MTGVRVALALLLAATPASAEMITPETEARFLYGPPPHQP